MINTSKLGTLVYLHTLDALIMYYLKVTGNWSHIYINYLVYGKKGTESMGTGKKGTSEKLGKKAQKEKIVFICRLLLLLFNQHLDYSM